ncbi:hypothetical protein Cni_G13970 [Canna indica]|uniref:Uncharacterized protein n=1 Tax=Canna indica TaxID=4628 RepID=A0AAQ3KDM0_9LILI|nr:hypothetical protein Cni_G13970 [Canna indica]
MASQMKDNSRTSEASCQPEVHQLQQSVVEAFEKDLLQSWNNELNGVLQEIKAKRIRFTLIMIWRWKIRHERNPCCFEGFQRGASKLAIEAAHAFLTTWPL